MRKLNFYGTMYKLNAFTFNKLKSYVDWPLLLFLILFLNVKLAVKIPAIIIIYLWRRDFKFGFHFRQSRLPLFYLFVIGIALVNFLTTGSYQSANYAVVLFTGIGFWLLCILAIHQLKLSVDQTDIKVLHQTILVFFIFNALFSFYNLAAIIIETRAINPFRYQGNHQKYFIGTGDYIKGLTYDIAITNAVINAMGVIYFLVRKNHAMVCVCMLVLLITGSNFINIALLLILTGLFILKSSSDQKSIIVVCAAFLVVFLIKVSPQNTRYIEENYNRIMHSDAWHVLAQTRAELPLTQIADTLLSPEERKRKFAMLYLDQEGQANRAKPEPIVKNTEVVVVDGRAEIPQPSIHSAPFQSRLDTSSEQMKLLAFIDAHEKRLNIPKQITQVSNKPGKIIALQQTLLLFSNAPQKILTGDGMGNFSSKLAFRASTLGFAGGFPERFTYINPDFLGNHLKLYLNYFSKRAGFHSITNMPNSVYDQLASEYGLIGLLAFVVFYVGYFFKHYRHLSYGIPLLLLVLLTFLMDYWFEQLSVIVLFELLLLLNIKETRVNLIAAYES